MILCSISGSSLDGYDDAILSGGKFNAKFLSIFIFSIDSSLFFLIFTSKLSYDSSELLSLNWRRWRFHCPAYSSCKMDVTRYKMIFQLKSYFRKKEKSSYTYVFVRGSFCSSSDWIIFRIIIVKVF